jgi:two-component SAPR family response regulator
MKRRKILVVDDESDITLAITMILEESGSKVDSYNDPVLALQNFKANFYDLIILDIKMPKMNGFDLCEKIIKIDDRVKVCFLTAWGEFRDYELRKTNTLCKEGKIQFIQKPIENEKLIELIDAIKS